MCGFAPHERRARELLAVSKDKRALKLIKKRVGTRIHAKMKRGAERRPSHHEERNSQEELNLSPPSTVNLSKQTKKKESDCNAIDLGSIPGWGRSPGEGNGNPLQYSRLGNSMDRGGWRAAKSQPRLSNSHTHRKEAMATPAHGPHTPGRGAGSGPAVALLAARGRASGWSPARSPHKGRRLPPRSLPPAAPSARQSMAPTRRHSAPSPGKTPGGPGSARWRTPLSAPSLAGRIMRWAPIPSPEAPFLGRVSPAPQAQGCRTGSPGWTGG